MGKLSFLGALGVLALLAGTRAMPQPGSNSSLEESAEARETKEALASPLQLMEEFRMMCRNNTGSDNANAAETVVMHSAMVCMMSSVDVANIMSDISTLSNKTRTTFFPKYCPQLKRAGSCLDELVKAARPCLNEQALNNVLALTSMYPDAVDLLCKNDGEIIFKLAEPKYKECIYSLWDKVSECTVPFGVESENWDISNLTESQMGAFSGLRQCIEGKLNVCQFPDLIRVYDLFDNTLLRLTSSRNVRPFLEKGFVYFVQYMSFLTKNESSTVNEYMPKVTDNETNAVNEK